MREGGGKRDNEERRWQKEEEELRDGRSKMTRKRGRGGRENYGGTRTAMGLKRDKTGITVH